MVGSAIKKYAAANGLVVKNGVAYGVYRGYMITLQEGAGWKSVDFAVFRAGHDPSFQPHGPGHPGCHVERHPEIPAGFPPLSESQGEAPGP